MPKGFYTSVAIVTLLFADAALAGINWKSVCLDSPSQPVHLKIGESQRYKIVGLDGADTKADLTLSPYLVIASSDPNLLEVDRKNARFIGRAGGHVEIRIRFSEATTVVKAIVDGADW
jgi:hypothetical protein